MTTEALPYGMHIEDDEAPTPVKEREPATIVRQDIVGRILDGEDYILNNPPGFAVGAALEYIKEHELDRR